MTSQARASTRSVDYYDYSSALYGAILCSRAHTARLVLELQGLADHVE